MHCHYLPLTQQQTTSMSKRKSEQTAADSSFASEIIFTVDFVVTFQNQMEQVPLSQQALRMISKGKLSGAEIASMQKRRNIEYEKEQRKIRGRQIVAQQRIQLTDANKNSTAILEHINQNQSCHIQP